MYFWNLNFNSAFSEETSLQMNGAGVHRDPEVMVTIPSKDSLGLSLKWKTGMPLELHFRYRLLNYFKQPNVSVWVGYMILKWPFISLLTQVGKSVFFFVFFFGGKMGVGEQCYGMAGEVV